ncbi:MAG: Translation initiation factor IF-1 [Mycoplasmataceae bacterium]|nr:MAG: Translation initiation factor IF-1 [Mycoplasmataceae bacterium]
MAKDFIKADGKIIGILPNGVFKIEIIENKQVITANMAGRLRKGKRIIKIVEGDKVSVEISPYDLEKGRIVYRF